MIADREGDPDFSIVDVRTPAEFSPEHIRNAVNIDFNAPHFEEEIDSLDKGNAYLVYCGSGIRSGAAAEMMRQHSFAAVYDLEGGLDALKQLGGADLPVVSCGCD